MAKKEKKGKGISRRTFIKGMGGGLAGSAIFTTGGLLSSEAKAELLGPELEEMTGSQTIELTVNGTVHRLTVEPRTTLLNGLRNHLHLTGTKQVCDRGQCGACTVLVEGQAVLSCMSLALDAREKDIVTVEGLARDGELTPLQQEFIEKDALMCGFCTPGFVVAATALLQTTPNPSPEEIKVGLSGNLCRCGTYPKVFEAVEAAAPQMRKGGKS